MCSIIKILCLLLALHGARSKEEAILLDYVEGRNDDRSLNKTTTEATTTFKDQSERAGFVTESIKETTTEMTPTDIGRLDTSETRSEESTEHAVYTEQEGRIAVTENDSNSSESTISQKTTTDVTTSFIDVEEQKAKQSSDDDESVHDTQISDSFGIHSTENDSQEAMASDSHKSHLSDDDIITIKIAASDKNVTEERTSDDDEESVETSSSEELVSENTFKSDTADLFNSSLLTRRMLGGYVMDLSAKSSGDSDQLPNIHVDNDSREVQYGDHKDLPLAPTTLITAGTSTLSQPSDISHHKPINSRLEQPHEVAPTSTLPEVLRPLFRSLTPSKPSLIQQLQPYLQALASTRPPIYNQYEYQHNASPIIQRLQQVTQELRRNLAKQLADLYSNKWNPLLNNVYNNRNRY